MLRTQQFDDGLGYDIADAYAASVLDDIDSTPFERLCRDIDIDDDDADADADFIFDCMRAVLNM